MIYTVTFNPSLDYIVSVDNFTCGIVNRTTDEIIFPGGKGINVSMVLKNFGCENTALGFMAGFTGQEIIRLLEEKGISTDFIHVAEGTSRINVKLRAQKETEINGQGPAIASADIKKLYEKYNKEMVDKVVSRYVKSDFKRKKMPIVIPTNFSILGTMEGSSMF